MYIIFSVMRKITTEYIAREQWAEAFSNLSDWEKRVMIVVASGACNRGSIARHSLISITSADNSILKLLEAGLIVVERTAPAGKMYKVAHAEMEKYCKSVDKNLVWNDAIDRIKIEIYQLTAQRFEALEHLGLIRGNGHHMAQEISESVKVDLQERWVK
jgi:predicted transcriptional regulator